MDSTPSHAANSFSPVRALGAAVDRLGIGVAEKELTGSMLQVLLDSGWQSISYRQNTELHAEAWLWVDNTPANNEINRLRKYLLQRPTRVTSC